MRHVRVTVKQMLESEVYILDLLRLINRHGLHPHLYADDTDIHSRRISAAMGDLAVRVAAYIDGTPSWMQSNRIELIADKIEFELCAFSRQLNQLAANSIRV